MNERIVIIGAGHAGGTVAAALRELGFLGAITLIGDEPIAPYQRPPLSKAWLKGEVDADALMLRPQKFYSENAITLSLSSKARRIDRSRKVVIINDGEELAYERLIIATGRRARRIPIPGGDLTGVLELRSAADADRLKEALCVAGRHLVIIGGGYIGLETAASARALGVEATVVEKEPRVLARVACVALSDFIQDYHRGRGVIFELGAGIDAITGERGVVNGLLLSDGRVLQADAVLMGVGAVANDEIAREAGLECSNGVVVDLYGRTSDPDVFAIGDCTNRPLPHYDVRGCLESVPNALEQARQVAAIIKGATPPAHEVPWFWSDQYDLKLQIAGVPHGASHVVVRADPGSTRFAVFHLTPDNRVLAVEAINAAPEFMMGRKLIASRAAVDPAKLFDTRISMKEVAV